MIDGTVESWKPFLSVTESALQNQRAGAIDHTVPLPTLPGTFLITAEWIPALMTRIKSGSHDRN